MAKRKFHIGFKEVIVGLVYVGVVYLLERSLLHERPEIVTALHFADPIVVPLVGAALGGISLSVTWAAFKSLARAVWFLVKWFAVAAVVIGAFVFVAKGSLIAALVVAVIGGNVVMAIASFGALATGLADFDPTYVPDEDKPWETETYGIPGIDPKQLPPGGFPEVPPEEPRK